MYIVFGNEIIDSSEIKDIIENNSDFNVEKDLTKGSKREDTLAYQISIDVALLNEVIKESYELDSIDEEELFDEYMTLSDELAMELEEYMPEDIIENNSDFNVEKDLTKGSKREDTLAYQISISVDLLNEVIKENYELDSLDEEELFDEYMTMADELAMELEEYMPEDVIINARAYKWDNSDNTIKLVLAMAHLELGELKLSDITRRLLTQVD